MTSPSRRREPRNATQHNRRNAVQPKPTVENPAPYPHGGAVLVFADGRELPADATGARWYVYLDGEGQEYRFAHSATELHRYEQASVRQLTRWACDYGHSWWASPQSRAKSRIAGGVATCLTS